MDDSEVNTATCDKCGGDCTCWCCRRSATSDDEHETVAEADCSNEKTLETGADTDMRGAAYKCEHKKVVDKVETDQESQEADDSAEAGTEAGKKHG